MKRIGKCIVLLFSVCPLWATAQQSREATPLEREVHYLIVDLDDVAGRALEAAIQAGNLGAAAERAVPKLETLTQMRIEGAETNQWLVERVEDTRREAQIALKRIQSPKLGAKVTASGRTIELTRIERDTGQRSRYVPTKPEHLWMRVAFKTGDPAFSPERLRASSDACGALRSGEKMTFAPSGGGLMAGNPVCIFAVWKKARDLRLELPGYPPLPLGF